MAWTLAGWKTTAVDLDNETLIFRKSREAATDAPVRPISDSDARSVAPTMDDFRDELTAHFLWAKLQQMNSIVIKAGDLHRSVGGYPTPFNRMTMCCNAMYQAQHDGDVIIEQPNKGYGAKLAIEYQLPRG
jgi:5-methylcytosine-specific restriction protein A